MNKVVFENEITLYWDKNWAALQKPNYSIFLNEKLICQTQKTHFSINSLSPETTYHIIIKEFIGENECVIFDENITTSKKKKDIDITKPPFCAVGDGKTVNTETIQKVLDSCRENERVYIPCGTFMTGALNIHSNTEIYIEKGGVLKGTAELSDYMPKIKSRFEGTEMMCYRSLINMGKLDRAGGYFCENVILRGGGTIHGGGEALANNIIEFETERLREYLEQNADYVATCENLQTIPGRSRGRLINMSNCKNIILSNLTLGFGPCWNVHFIYSKDILTYGCKIESSGVWNGDGWDPDSSEDCTIFNTEFKTHDDGIAIKSGKNPEGNIINRPTKNIRIFDCFGRKGIAIGSELSGGIDGVFVWDCEYLDWIGIQLKTTKKRGGYIKNVRVKDSSFACVQLATNLSYNNDGEGAETITDIENISFSDLTLTARGIDWDNITPCRFTPIKIEGFEDEEHFAKNLSFKNIKSSPVFSKEESIKISGVKDLTIENVTLEN